MTAATTTAAASGRRSRLGPGAAAPGVTVRRENPTIRGLLRRLAGGRGHWVFAGTPEQVADEITRWFTEGAAHGINVMPPYFPGGLEDFVEQVVPILRRRGLFREEYEGSTLRDHFGLDQPASRYAEAG